MPIWRSRCSCYSAGKHFIMNARLKRLNAETMDPVSGEED